MASARAGVDIGGTFTDFLLYDEETGNFSIAKTLSTPREPSRAVEVGLRQLEGLTGQPLAGIGQIVHGTTLVTNALIERKGAKTALITTMGFRDALEIAREHRYDLYDLFLELPEPLVPRYLRFEIDERVLSDGSILKPLDLSQVGDLVEAIRAEEIHAVAICLIHSYQYPDHERLLLAELERLAPELVYSTSSDVAPEIREYERCSTTVANVYVRPLVDRYITDLIERLERSGFRGSFFVMLSSGGLCDANAARRYPIRLVESGPAAGALAAAHIGRASGRQSLLSFDMGGTTAKCCLITEDGLSLSEDFEVSRVYRFMKGSGLPVSIPAIELIEIGAGGGSVARVDNLGLLKVGPKSAGADPGPACYGRGGTQPTVTDADLLLGYLDPNHFLGGSMQLDPLAAEAAIRPLADQLGMSIVDAAWGIHQVVNEQMAGAARIHAIERGEDSSLFPVFAFGGAGPVHAYRMAEILRSAEVIVPFGAGVASTIGFLVAPVSFDFVRTHISRLDVLDWPEINAKFKEMEREGTEMLVNAGIDRRNVSSRRFADLRYVGQGHEVRIHVNETELSETSARELTDEFESAYRRIYGRVAHGNPVEATNWRVIVTAPTPQLPLERMGAEYDGEARNEPEKGARRAYLPEAAGFVDVPVIDRYALRPGYSRAGPAIIEERESTIVVGKGATISVDPLANVIIDMPKMSSDTDSAPDFVR
jgi:N-methylhydantoinase A